MKVAFYVYPTAFQSPGGGEILLLKTKEYLEKEGQPVTLFNPWTDKLKDFDILHTFGSVKDCLPMMRAARLAGVKNVLSTVCWYSWRSAWGTQGTAKDRSLALLRHSAKVFFPWVPSQRKTMMEISDVLCPNSEVEAGQLLKFFGVPRNKISVLPTGVDPVFSQAAPGPFVEKYNLKNFVLCVGRIEPRKNQLNMVRALSGQDVKFVLIGDYVPHYKAYYEQCRKEAGENVVFLGGLEHGSPLLASAYAACDTFLLASWLETPGLAALEAALAGAKIVITSDGATREYFKDYALYVSPGNAADIRAKVLQSRAGSKNPNLKQLILENYLWQRVAQKTKAVYEVLVSGKAR
jgi:glycosyltransferase involved in cell wall biosynthesis